MEALARYDSRLVVGILGGSAGTTLDAFQMLADAKKYGARVALYGRKINHAEHQLSFVRYLRAIADSQMEPVEAVKAYHNDLQKLAVTPRRSLENDLQRMESTDSYSGRSLVQKTSKVSKVSKKKTDTQSDSPDSAKPDSSKPDFSKPDFSKMTAAEKVQWNLDRLKRVFG
jgi:hypothetical protein